MTTTDVRLPLLASRWHRLLAFVIDLLVVGTPPALVFGLVDDLRPHAAYYLLLVWWTLPYFAFFNGRGRTLGKLVLGLRVADDSTGKAIGVRRAAIRHLAVIGAAALVVPLLLDVLVSARDAYRRAAHDIRVRSLVVTT